MKTNLDWDPKKNRGSHPGIGIDTQNPRIIIVADSDDRIIGYLIEEFHGESYTCIWALNTGDLVEWLKSCSPAVLIISTDLIGMSITELVPMVKLIVPGTPVIIVTGTNPVDLDTEISLRREGIFYFFHKSFDLDELKLAVENAARTANRSNSGGGYRER